MNNTPMYHQIFDALKNSDLKVKCVYVLALSNNRVKVGSTQSVTDRARRIEADTHTQTIFSYRTDFMPTPFATKLERKCHAKLAKYRVSGEYYDVNFREAERIVDSFAWEVKDFNADFIDYCIDMLEFNFADIPPRPPLLKASNDRFGTLRYVVVDGVVWFVAVDVCNALGISNPRRAVSRLADDEKMKLDINISTNMPADVDLMRVPNKYAQQNAIRDNVGSTDLNFVNEFGLYRLIFMSHKPEAELFRHWVFHEVLPSIHYTGKYSLRQPPLKELGITRAQYNHIIEECFFFARALDDKSIFEHLAAVCLHNCFV